MHDLLLEAVDLLLCIGERLLGEDAVPTDEKKAERYPTTSGEPPTDE